MWPERLLLNERKRGCLAVTPKSHRLWLAVLLLLVAAGCRRHMQDTSDVLVNLTVTPDPPVLGPTTVFVELKNALGEPIPDLAVEMEGNMNHPGMAPVFGKATEIAPGQYKAELELTMIGEWFITVRSTLPDGRSLERQMGIPKVRHVKSHE